MLRLLRSSRRWPFWLLLAAWFCANSPQPAAYAVLGWLAEARSFSHQRQLTADVAYLLGGEKRPSRYIAWEQTRASDESRPPLTIPQQAVLKKIDLSDESETEQSPPRRVEIARQAELEPQGGRLRAPPLHGPPRPA